MQPRASVLTSLVLTAFAARGCKVSLAWAGGAACNRHWSTLRGSARTLRRGAASSKLEESRSEEQLLDSWRLLPNGRFRGQLQDGLVVEFEGELVGPQDPGIVLGPGGVRYALGDAGRDGTSSPTTGMDAAGVIGATTTQLGADLVPVVAAAVASAVAAVLTVFAASGSFQQSPASLLAQVGEGPVTRTNVSIVETRRTLPDGTQAKIVDKTTRRERTVPGKAPVVTEQTTRTEKVVRDQRAPR
mmetsp:Transcript_95950/g.222421  ORF Transcript_95950/g.222421 Transcript_95950/m.222421 type:complete len:244 (+) Transcript_95950:78-809(+)